MSRISKTRIAMICCSVYKKEIELLCREQWPGHKLLFLDSILHLYPEKLAQSIKSLVDGELAQGKKVILIYGDCCPQMAEIEAKPNVARTRGNNCFDMMLGREEYRRLSHEGAFFLMSEWTQRWKEFFINQLGLNADNAASFMQDMHRKLVYLDTGMALVPENSLSEFAKYCGLPYEIKQIPLEHLHAAIEEALLRLETREVSK